MDHIYTMDASEAGHPDEGLVGIMIQSGDVCADAVMTAQEALLLADRLTRGAQLVLDTGEDLPDAEREYQRLSRARPAGDR